MNIIEQLVRIPTRRVTRFTSNVVAIFPACWGEAKATANSESLMRKAAKLEKQAKQLRALASQPKSPQGESVMEHAVLA